MRTTLLILVACQSPKGGDGPPLSPSTGDPSTPTPTTDTPPEPDALLFSDLDSRLHPDLGSLVYARFTQSLPATVRAEYSVDPGEWRSTPDYALDAGPHEILLLGVPYDSDVSWRLVGDAGAGPVTSGTEATRTDALPATVPAGEVLVADADRLDPASPYWFLSLGGDPYWILIVDRDLRVVWASPSPEGTVCEHPRVAKDGRSLYIDRNTYWATFDSSGATVVQWLVDGTLLHEFATPGAHHPFTDLPDGSVAYGKAQGYDTEYLQIVHPDGSAETLWDCGAWLATFSGGYCNSNTLNYDPDTDKFLFSFWSVESVVQIDGATGAVDGWFGHLPGAYAFDPEESAFWWQHGGYLTADGTFMTSSDRTSEGVETVVREYAIDEATQTLREVWSFGEDEGLYGRFMGEPHRLGNGNTAHNYGGLARIREVTPDGEVVWDAGWPSAEEIGRSMPIADLYPLAPTPQ